MPHARPALAIGFRVSLALSCSLFFGSVAASAHTRGQHVVDAVCPLVSKVHADVIAHHRAGRHVL
jgi:hypothetical protein